MTFHVILNKYCEWVQDGNDCSQPAALRYPGVFDEGFTLSERAIGFRLEVHPLMQTYLTCGGYSRSSEGSDGCLYSRRAAKESRVYHNDAEAAERSWGI